MKNILDQLTDLDEKQLVELNSAICGHIKFLRAAKSRAIKTQLSEGAQVSWVGQDGHRTGTVVSIKRKFAHVSTNTGTWRVPMSMLKVMS